MKKPKIFIQDTGSYPHDILVTAGASKKETYEYLKKNRVNPKYSKWFLQEYDSLREGIDSKLAGAFYFGEIDKEHTGMGIFIRPYVDSWNYWEILMHEIHHLVLYIAKQKQFLNENENQAYLYEYLFRSIRRKLQGLDMV